MQTTNFFKKQKNLSTAHQTIRNINKVNKTLTIRNINNPNYSNNLYPTLPRNPNPTQKSSKQITNNFTSCSLTNQLTQFPLCYATNKRPKSRNSRKLKIANFCLSQTLFAFLLTIIKNQNQTIFFSLFSRFLRNRRNNVTKNIGIS